VDRRGGGRSGGDEGWMVWVGGPAIVAL
jgi:hypothetical protein